MESGIHLVGRVDEPGHFSTLNPASGEQLGSYPIASPQDVGFAVARARQAQRWWAELPLVRRSAVLRRTARLICDEKEALARTITAESGKPLAESLVADVFIAINSANFSADNAAAVLRPQRIPHSNPTLRLKSGRLSFEPLGVIGMITPWNYPLAIPAGDIFGALATGNAVVVKPSELTPQSVLELERILSAALDAEGITSQPRPLQVITGMAETGQALINSPIDKLIFTGSVATGRQVATAAAARLLPVILELGGKDPMIVLSDADLDVASSAAVWGSMMNAGQTCLSVERCYVHRSVLARFLDLCRDKMAKINVGNGALDGVDMGPLISVRQMQKVAEQVEDARAQGADILVGGEPMPHLGPSFYSPTLITGLEPSMRLMREETFGPVLPVVAFRSDEEAIGLANDSHYALGASVWGRTEHATAVARRIHASSVLVNDVLTAFAVPDAPHAGFKHSGMGRTHGILGMQELVRSFYVDVDLAPRMKKLWWYPYAGAFAPLAAFADLLHGGGSARLNAVRRALPALFRRRH